MPGTVMAMARDVAHRCECGGEMEQWLPHHWRCTACGHHWVDRPAIFRRLEAELYQLPLARVRVQIPVPASRLDEPRVDGGWPVPATERYVLEREREAWVVEALNRALTALNQEELRLVQLRYWDRYSWQRVADRMGVPRRTVFAMRERILERLAAALGWFKKPPQKNQH